VRIALCQMNARVGDIAGNAGRIKAGIAAAKAAKAALVAFPELAVTGYPPEDLLMKEHFLADATAALEEIAKTTKGIVAVVGFPERGRGKHRAEGKAPRVYNAAAVTAEGAVRSVYRKVRLPNYGVFDERRYFAPGKGGATTEVKGRTVGLTVCEDMWLPGGPAAEAARSGARVIVNISASPYHAGKGMERERLFGERAREHGAYVAFCGQVGGQDELVFDGHSFVVDERGETIARGAQFQEDLLMCDLGFDSEGGPAGRAKARARSAEEEKKKGPKGPTVLRGPIEPEEAEVYAALRLGLRDYVEKNGFKHVVLGLSGGIDSALVACIAADALGPERVSAAIMPSEHSSEETQGDARRLAAALGLSTYELPIGGAMEAYTTTLREELEGREADLTEENLQARIRGNLLMALSNRYGWLVLTTGNKSEMSVGYTTLYGDLAGGFAVIKDVPKTLVYALSEWRNGADGPIPKAIIEREPTAELRKGQRDRDSLPPYGLLDRILNGYIEQDRSREQLIAAGLPQAEVDRTIELVDRAEYKRRQAPPGIKISRRAFGRDRRMPITNGYADSGPRGR
jgi:NAD+ synthase (glutamine-hydrolysing)